MATVQEPTRTVSRAEAFVAGQIARASRRVRSQDLAVAALGLVVGGLAYALLMVLLDRWLVLPALARQAALVVALLGAVAYVFIAVLRPVRLTVNPYYAARQVERAIPEAKNSVVSWLDLRDEPLPPAIRQAVGLKAAHDLEQADVEEAVRDRRLPALGFTAGGLTVAAVLLLLVLRPAPFLSLLGRNLAPFAFSATTIASQTRLTIVQPAGGDATVSLNQPVEFRVRADGRVPDPAAADAVRLQWRYSPNDPVWEEQPFEPDAQDAGAFAVRVPGYKVQNGFVYRVAGGDAVTAEHTVRVRSGPLVERFEVTYRARPYLRFADQTATSPNLKGLRGTEVTLVAVTNRAVRDGWLRFTPAGTAPAAAGQPAQPAKVVSIPAERLPDRPDALRFRLRLERDGSYVIAFTAADGESNEQAGADVLPTYTIEVLADQIPHVEVTRPAGERLPINGTLQVGGLASDDFGLTKLRLCLRAKDDARAQAVPLASKPYRAGTSFAFADGTYPRSLDYQDFLPLDQLRTELGGAVTPRAGMVIEYWLEAEDNYDDPKPNVGRSKVHTVEIGAPQDPAEKKEQDEQVRANQQQHEQRQDEALRQEGAGRQPADPANAGQPGDANPAGQGQGQDQRNGNRAPDGAKPPDAQPDARRPDGADGAPQPQDGAGAKPEEQQTKSIAEKIKDMLNQREQGAGQNEKGVGNNAAGANNAGAGNQNQGAGQNQPQGGAGANQPKTADGKAAPKPDGGAGGTPNPMNATPPQPGGAEQPKTGGNANQPQAGQPNAPKDPKNDQPKAGANPAGQGTQPNPTGGNQGNQGEQPQGPKPDAGQPPAGTPNNPGGTQPQGPKPDGGQPNTPPTGTPNNSGTTQPQGPKPAAGPPNPKPDGPNDPPKTGTDNQGVAGSAQANPKDAPKPGGSKDDQGAGAKQPGGQGPSQGEQPGQAPKQGTGHDAQSAPNQAPQNPERGGAQGKTGSGQPGTSGTGDKPEQGKTGTNAQGKTGAGAQPDQGKAGAGAQGKTGAGGQPEQGKTGPGGQTGAPNAGGKQGDGTGQTETRDAPPGSQRGGPPSAQPKTGGTPQGEGRPDKGTGDGGRAPSAQEIANLAKDLASADPQAREQARRKLEDLKNNAADAQARRQADEALRRGEGAGEGTKPGDDPNASRRSDQPGGAGAAQPKAGTPNGPPQPGVTGQGDPTANATGQANQPPNPNATAGQGNDPTGRGAPAGAQGTPPDGAGNRTTTNPGTGATVPGGGGNDPSQPDPTQQAGHAGSGVNRAARRDGAGGSEEGAPGGAGGVADPRHASRAGELQLEDFKKVDKKLLNDLKMSEAEWQKFQQAYADMLRRRAAEKDAPGAADRQRGAATGNSAANRGARRVQGGTGPADPLERGGPAAAPPEYREGYRGFTEDISKSQPAPKKGSR